MRITFRDYATFAWREAEVTFEAEKWPFGRLLFRLNEDGEEWAFQPASNAILANRQQWPDAVEIDGLRPVKTEGGGQLWELLFRFHPDQEAPCRTLGAMIRRPLAAPAGNLGAVPPKRGDRASWPRVSAKAQARAAAVWDAWPGTQLKVGAGPTKTDCFCYHRRELVGLGIKDGDHFKAVLDSARKRPPRKASENR